MLVKVEPEPSATPVTRGLSVNETIERADETFEAALTTVRNVAQGVVAQLTDLAVRPSEVTVSFGVELSGKAGAILVSTAASAQLTVSLVWRADSTHSA